MSENYFKKYILYKRNSRLIHFILLLIVAVAIGIPVFQSKYIYPLFNRQLLDNAQREAVWATRNIEKFVLPYFSDGNFLINDEAKRHLDNLRDLNFSRVRIFSSS